MKLLKIAIALFLYMHVSAQLHDAQWVLGYHNSVLDFRNPDTVTNYSIPTSIYFTLTNANICDENGSLLYYTNGVCIAGPNDTLMNGCGLSPCPYSDDYSIIGLNIQQGALFIPKPGDSSSYYLFHFSNDTLQIMLCLHLRSECAREF